jgi:hypothetical protein
LHQLKKLRICLVMEWQQLILNDFCKSELNVVLSMFRYIPHENELNNKFKTKTNYIQEHSNISDPFYTS